MSGEEVDELDPAPARVTVSLTRKSVERVERLSGRHEDTKTDTINRAIALYDMFDEMERAGAGLYTRDADGGWIQLKLIR